MVFLIQEVSYRAILELKETAEMCTALGLLLKAKLYTNNTGIRLQDSLDEGGDPLVEIVGCSKRVVVQVSFGALCLLGPDRKRGSDDCQLETRASVVVAANRKGRSRPQSLIR
jgi:hypothetical protein